MLVGGNMSFVSFCQIVRVGMHACGAVSTKQAFDLQVAR